LRTKGLVEKLPRSRRYRLVGKGYSVCLIFLPRRGNLWVMASVSEPSR
jgi:hypothetical protein